MDKASFVLYADYKQHIDLLSLEEKGLLLDAIFRYVNDEELPELSGMSKMAFSFIRSGLDRDAEKYERICDKRRQAANKRWDMQKDANASKSISSNAMHYDSVSDTDNENDNDSGTDNVPLLPATATAPSLSEVEKFYREYCTEKGYTYDPTFSERFLEYPQPKDWKNRVREWADDNAKKPPKRQKQKSGQNFTPSGIDWNELFYKHCANNS